MLGVRRLIHFGNCTTTDEPLDPGDGSHRAIRPGQLQVQLSNKKGPASPLGQTNLIRGKNNMETDYYANGFKHAEDRLVKALADLDSIIRNEPETRGALRAEVRAILEQLDVAKDLIDKEAQKRLGD